MSLKESQPTVGMFLEMDPKTERFTGAGAEDANKLLTRAYRKGFEVPEKL